MGCDIHLFVEVRESNTAPWRPALVKTPCNWCQIDADRECYFCKGTKLDSGYHDRNYNVFAILADVRNGTGFAGCDTGDCFDPISEPRGLPKDLSPELRAAHECDFSDDDESGEKPGTYAYNRKHYGCGNFGDHSHSWLMLHELNSCNWSRANKHRGLVDPKEFAAWDAKGGGRPSSWCGGVGGLGVKIISNDEMRALVAGGYEEPKTWPRDSYYTRVEWSETYAASARRFHSVFLPELQRLGEQFGNDNVRIVFGFDS